MTQSNVTPGAVSADELLEELHEYFEDRADAEYFTDRAAPVGNEEMRLLGVVEQLCELAALKSQQTESPVRCGMHEAYQGECVHCGVAIVNGRAVKGPQP